MSGWFLAVKKREPLIRKGASFLKQVPRFISRAIGAWDTCPSALANSFPKSGTHLLIQILEGLPGIRNYDSFIASIPSIRFRQRSDRSILRRIGWIAPGEAVSAHLFYSPKYVEALEEKRCVRFFIYRDPRDVAVSEAHYLTYMNRWHRAHRYFAYQLHTDADRLMTAITGIPAGLVSYSYPNVRDRFEPYRGWLHDVDTFAVRFEDLVGPDRDEMIRRMVEFYSRKSNSTEDWDAVVTGCIRRIDASRSHTFRAGVSGAWRNVFKPRHTEAMKAVATDLLVDLGYEAKADW